jgi:crotonobetainyl-CoA:carnitine CoA-transferase CaiB-like acyl-CoA transferase
LQSEPTPPSDDFLTGLRVLDLADESGSMCGRILADLGADVVKVEAPGGDSGRRVPPFAADRPEPERSLAWLASNVNKRGITCNLQVNSGRALFRRLADRADVVLETFPPGELDARQLGYQSLAATNPGLILTSITPFGTDGPRASWPASDLEVAASSGSLWLAGDPSRPPVRSSLPQSPGWAGMYAAMGTLTAFLARQASGVGQQVDVSAQASLITAISHAPIFWDLLGENPSRSGPFLSGRSVSGAVFRNIWPCRDGYVTFALYGGPAGRETGKALVAWMEQRGGAPEVLRRLDWDQFDVATVPPDTVRDLEAAIGPFLLGLTRAEFFAGVVERNMLGYPVATVEDIRSDKQLAARSFWQEVEAPWADGGSLPFPGSFAFLDGVRPSIRRTAPRLGEHNAEIYGGELGLTADELVALRGAGVL